jgi:hypothetical protein
MLQAQVQEHGTRALEAEESKALCDWIGRDTERVVLDAIGLSRQTLARCAAGLQVHASTRVAARAALARRAS